MAAPLGNTNGKKQRLFEQAVIRAIKQRDLTAGDGETLRRVADKLIEMATGGDPHAIVQLRDTLDGRPAQAITGPDGGPLQIERIEVVIVDPAK